MTAPNPPDDEILARALHRSRVMEDAPEALIQRSIDLFTRSQATPVRTLGTPALEAPGLLRKLAAVLAFDSSVTPVAGLRGGPASSRQMLFTADGRDIDLRVQRAIDGRHWRISGQVLGPDLHGTAALVADGYSAEVQWNELSEFSFDQVPSGRCSLVLRTAAWELVLPEFQASETE